jgi:hypothetical protein
MIYWSNSIFLQKEFISLIIFSIILPVIIYRMIWHKKTISRMAVLYFGATLILLAGIDVFLLRIMVNIAKNSPGMVDDVVFNSEISAALYLLPALYAGTGINLVSHILISHLTEAEKQFDSEHLALASQHEAHKKTS